MILKRLSLSKKNLQFLMFLLFKGLIIIIVMLSPLIAYIVVPKSFHVNDTRRQGNNEVSIVNSPKVVSRSGADYNFFTEKSFIGVSDSVLAFYDGVFNKGELSTSYKGYLMDFPLQFFEELNFYNGINASMVNFEPVVESNEQKKSTSSKILNAPLKSSGYSKVTIVSPVKNTEPESKDPFSLAESLAESLNRAEIEKDLANVPSKLQPVDPAKGPLEAPLMPISTKPSAEPRQSSAAENPKFMQEIPLIELPSALPNIDLPLSKSKNAELIKVDEKSSLNDLPSANSNMQGKFPEVDANAEDAMLKAIPVPQNKSNPPSIDYSEIVNEKQQSRIKEIVVPPEADLSTPKVITQPLKEGNVTNEKGSKINVNDKGAQDNFKNSIVKPPEADLSDPKVIAQPLKGGSVTSEKSSKPVVGLPKELIAPLKPFNAAEDSKKDKDPASKKVDEVPFDGYSLETALPDKVLLNSEAALSKGLPNVEIEKAPITSLSLLKEQEDLLYKKELDEVEIPGAPNPGAIIHNLGDTKLPEADGSKIPDDNMSKAKLNDINTEGPEKVELLKSQISVNANQNNEDKQINSMEVSKEDQTNNFNKQDLMDFAPYGGLNQQNLNQSFQSEKNSSVTDNVLKPGTDIVGSYDRLYSLFPELILNSKNFENMPLKDFMQKEDYLKLVFDNIKNEDLVVLSALIDLVRTTEFENKNGETPLFYAAKLKRINSVKLLISKGAKVKTVIEKLNKSGIALRPDYKTVMDILKDKD